MVSFCNNNIVSIFATINFYMQLTLTAMKIFIVICNLQQWCHQPCFLLGRQLLYLPILMRQRHHQSCNYFVQLISSNDPRSLLPDSPLLPLIFPIWIFIYYYFCVFELEVKIVTIISSVIYLLVNVMRFQHGQASSLH